MQRDELDVMAILDAVYRVELDGDVWLHGIVRSVRPALDVGFGVVGCAHDASRASQVSSVVEAGAAFGEANVASLTAFSWGAIQCRYARTMSDIAVWTSFERHGVFDAFVINGTEPSGSGISVAALLPESHALDSDAIGFWSPIAAHFARAASLRRRLKAVPRGCHLTEREREVLAAAAAGSSTKVIAFDLGIADATVRVLLLRAAKKLGARNRNDAIARFAQAQNH